MAAEIFIDISKVCSFTDCFSFVVMRGLRLREALG
jgi:predicted nucleic acid-binding protein